MAFDPRHPVPVRGRATPRWLEVFLALVTLGSLAWTALLAFVLARRGVRGDVVNDPDAAAAVLGSLAFGTVVGLLLVIGGLLVLPRRATSAPDGEAGRGVWLALGLGAAVLLQWIVELTDAVLVEEGRGVPVDLFLCLQGVAVGVLGVPILAVALLLASRRQVA